MRTLSLLALLALSSCVISSSEQRYDVDEVAAQYSRDVATLHRAQAKLEREYPTPISQDFGAAGAIYIDEVALVGRPGHSKFRVHFTWVNTTETDYPVVDIRLTLTDNVLEAEWSETLEMRLPYRLRLTPSSSYTSWFEMPAHGVYLRDDWSWDIEVRAHERDPLWD